VAILLISLEYVGGERLFEAQKKDFIARRNDEIPIVGNAKSTTAVWSL